MRICIFGATSQIAKDLVLAFSRRKSDELMLFARRPTAVAQWLDSVGMSYRYPVSDFEGFGFDHHFDAIVNFVGVGNPAQATVTGASIFDVTLKYDDMVLDYIRQHPVCRYIFISSGAAYGSNFEQPVDENSKAVIAINRVDPQHWYSVAKLHAECRHRSLQHLPIVDIRVFNYFSHTQDISARFLITDVLRAIQSSETLVASSDNIVRDYIGPDDFYQLVLRILAAPAANDVVDLYTKAPIDKRTLLSTMKEQFGLVYEVRTAPAGINATGAKMNYFSLNRRASIYGYSPSKNSLDNVVAEASLVINGNFRR